MPKLLIVDDEVDIAEVVQMVATSLKLDTCMAPTGHDAMQLLQACQPEVLLLDWTLPDISGAELLRTVHHQWPTIKILVVTGHGDNPQLVQEALAHGALRVLAKPLRLSVLKQTLTEVLGTP